jgi:hypothetical protein
VNETLTLTFESSIQRLLVLYHFRPLENIHLPPPRSSRNNMTCKDVSRNNQHDDERLLVLLLLEANEVGQPHNHRHDDGCRRIYCDPCGNRDLDSRYGAGDHYTNCKSCRNAVCYKKNLEWCHKCFELCLGCQSNECPKSDDVRLLFVFSGQLNKTTSRAKLESIASIFA